MNDEPKVHFFGASIELTIKDALRMISALSSVANSGEQMNIKIYNEKEAEITFGPFPHMNLPVVDVAYHFNDPFIDPEDGE
jgi:hypothetical protein